MISEKPPGLVPSKFASNTLDQWSRSRRFWTDPVSAAIAPWFHDDKTLAFKLEFAELISGEELKVTLRAENCGARDSSHESCRTVTTKIRNFEGEDASVFVLDIIDRHLN